MILRQLGTLYLIVFISIPQLKATEIMQDESFEVILDSTYEDTLFDSSEEYGAQSNIVANNDCDDCDTIDYRESSIARELLINEESQTKDISNDSTIRHGNSIDGRVDCDGCGNIDYGEFTPIRDDEIYIDESENSRIFEGSDFESSIRHGNSIDGRGGCLGCGNVDYGELAPDRDDNVDESEKSLDCLHTVEVEVICNDGVCIATEVKGNDVDFKIRVQLDKTLAE